MFGFDFRPTPAGHARGTARVMAALVAAVALSVLAGAVLASGLLPAASAGIVAVKSGAAAWESLPKEPPSPPLPGRTTIVTSRGEVVAQVFTINRVPVAAESQSEHLRKAVVAIEDANFFSHGGLDLRGTARAALSTVSGSGVQGGSTITQQYAKNLRITQAVIDGGGSADPADVRQATEGSVHRKLVEARMATTIESRQTKDEILTGYLNVSYFGRGAFGAEAASQRYFSKPAADLNLEQAALLAGLLQAPSRYDPLSNPDLAAQRRTQVLDRMRQTGVITPAQAEQAQSAPLRIRPSSPRQGCEAAKAAWAFVCDSAVREMGKADWAGAEAKKLLGAGGLTMRLTVDPRAQGAANRAAGRIVPRKHRVANAVVVVEPGTGRVLAMGTNRRFGVGQGRTEIPLATTASFSPGSTFKIFTLTAALEAGIPLSTRLPAGDTYFSSAFDNPPGGYHNAEGLSGSNVTIPEATQRSLNTAFVQLEERVGVDAVAGAARRLGIRSIPAPGKRGAPGRREGSFTLGTRDVSVTDMAGAYAAVAAHGRWCPPHLVDSVTLPDGSVVKNPRSGCRQAVAAPVADTVSSVLRGVITDGTGKSAALPGSRPAAGKTGTSENAGAAWFAGFTPQAAAAVWTGDPRSPRNSLHDVLGRPIVYGGTLPAELWKASMSAYLKGKPVLAMPGVDPAYLLGLGAANPDAAMVPDVVGTGADEATARLLAAGFQVVARDAPADERTRPGTVVAQSPKPGSTQRRGSRITVTVARSPN